VGAEYLVQPKKEEMRVVAASSLKRFIFLCYAANAFSRIKSLKVMGIVSVYNN